MCTSNTSLEIKDVDFFTIENSKEHHTDKFELVHADPPTPVLRRGQSFYVQLNFKERCYDRKIDVLRLVFTFGCNPSPVKGTEGALIVTESTKLSEDNTVWDVCVVEEGEKSLKLQVQIPVDAPVGEWNLDVKSGSVSQILDKPDVYKCPNKIYILFNPWCKDDQVYMDDSKLLKEYILTDYGKVWMGNHKTCRGREWVFGQFDECVLPACMLMLDVTMGKTPTKRGDPVLVSRAISKIVNCNDERGEGRGVIAGKWGDKYDGGTAPWEWTGSVAILEEYLATKKEVRYGQCWVFAAVTNTVCRALGIPSRVVTNFDSAHDTDMSLSIDYYYDLKGKESYKDSIWNFHVWNDVWMARPDLPKGYGGWQAIDATPQELSHGFFQCGPAPLEAIKCGNVGFSYDVAYMVASVNADIIRWKEDPKSKIGYSPISHDKNCIGKLICTKKPGVFDPCGEKDREDITNQYKPPEGTDNERIALMNAVGNTRRARCFYGLTPTKSNEIEFELPDIETVEIGKDFCVTLKIHNKSCNDRTVDIVLTVSSMRYDGVKVCDVKCSTGKLVMNANSKKEHKLNVLVCDYIDKLVEYNNMKICAQATVEETNETWAKDDDFQIITPKLNVKVDLSDGVCKSPNTVTFSFSFTNPLKKTLTDCKFIYECSGITKRKTICYRDIEEEEKVNVEDTLCFEKTGKFRVVGTFHSKQLGDITGCEMFKIKKDLKYIEDFIHHEREHA